MGLPVGLILLTEWQHALAQEELPGQARRPAAQLPAAAGGAAAAADQGDSDPDQETPVRVVATLFGFVVLVLLLSGVNATLFQGAPEGTWRKRIPRSSSTSRGSC